MLPFGQAAYLWRLKRGYSQARLAARAGIPQPNLSAIEAGDREVTLSTLRALAAALDVTPGTLADGAAPGRRLPAFSREALDRVARAAQGGARPRDADEREAAALFAPFLSNQRAAEGKGRPRPARPRAARGQWLAAAARFRPATLRALARRAAERAGAR